MMEIFLLLLGQDPNKEKEHMEFKAIRLIFSYTSSILNFSYHNFSLLVPCPQGSSSPMISNLSIPTWHFMKSTSTLAVFASWSAAPYSDFYFCFHNMVYSFSPVASSKPWEDGVDHKESTCFPSFTFYFSSSQSMTLITLIPS